ncbi:hypothetical protein PC667_004421 [Salmonella enterica]|nr:hypothetical protein [Salmonella enterica]EKI4014633.1 hypothetical protein [Salmonella enterica]
MREKIKTPVVIINKRETSDSYVVSVTDGSNNFHDGVLLVGVKPVEKNDRFAVFSMAGSVIRGNPLFSAFTIMSGVKGQ